MLELRRAAVQCNGDFEGPNPVPELLVLAVQATFQNALLSNATKFTERIGMSKRQSPGRKIIQVNNVNS